MLRFKMLLRDGPYPSTLNQTSYEACLIIWFRGSDTTSGEHFDCRIPAELTVPTNMVFKGFRI